MHFPCQGRDTPSPADTPYLCRQRNSNASLTNRLQEMNELERGALLDVAHSSTQSNCGCNPQPPPSYKEATSV